MSWRPPTSLPPIEEWRTHEAVRCLECGIWKRSLGKHLNAAHDMTAVEYRKQWGMRQRQPLSSGEVSETRRRIAIESGGPERLKSMPAEQLLAAQAAARKREHRPQEIASTTGAMIPRRLSKQAAARDAVRQRIEKETGQPFLEWARARYLDEQLPLRALADEAGTHDWTIKALLRDAGIELRPRGPLKGVPAKRRMQQ